MTSCRGDSQMTGSFFMVPAVAFARVQPMKTDASFLYFGVNLFCLFFGKRLVMLLYITY